MTQKDIVFFGTQEFAQTILSSLVDNGWNIVYAVTQPDRAVGRSKTPQASAVKQYAQARSIDIFQPESLKHTPLPPQNCAIAVCAQYGAIIPEYVLHAFPLGIINVHTSLLPHYRGASPIQTALRNGDAQTGITIMKMDKGMDTGPTLAQSPIDIFPDETYPELEKRMAEHGALLLGATLPAYIQGDIMPHPQKNEDATACRLITRDDGRINWQTQSTSQIYNAYRAFTPWPGIWSTYKENRLKLLSIQKSTASGSPGMFLTKENRLYIGTIDASVEILSLQPEGKREMTAKEFLCGHPLLDGQQLL
jgi:methionyl-tRNA formyltransferase